MTDGAKTQPLPRAKTRPLAGLLGGDQNFLETIIDNLPVALFAKDVSDDYRMVLWNKKQAEVTTVRKERALGRTDFDMFSHESAQYFREVDEAVVKRGKLVEVPEEIIDTEKGGEIWVRTVKVPITLQDGKRTLLVGISEDITERVHSRSQLRKLNKNLSKANEELRSTQLALIQAEKMESVGRLAAGVAHEVKNPLALLLMGVEYLSSGIEPGDENVGEILTEMREAINRADKIVRGLVDFSSDRQLHREPTNVSELIEHTLLLIRHEITRNSVTIESRYEENLPEISLDSSKFEQVLINLMINAIHAMRDTSHPKLEIRVSCRQLEDIERNEGVRTAHHLRTGDDAIVIEIVDNGTGISDEHARKLFDPFFTTKATGVGTGLGLSVVRKIIELHDGSISLENRLLGTGAKVTITLKAPRDSCNGDELCEAK